MKNLQDVPFIPLPVSIQSNNDSGDNFFLFTPIESIIYLDPSLIVGDEHCDSSHHMFQETAQYLSDKIGVALVTPKTSSSSPAQVLQKYNHHIIFHRCSDCDEAFQQPLEKEEGYILKIEPGVISCYTMTPHGMMNSIQTLLQLFPPQMICTNSTNISGTKQPSLQTLQVPWPIPCGIVFDQPKYSYRGTMLDVARHFFNVHDIKRHIDLIAQYKINVLHLHLTDDQGWRIEIKSWPQLTLIGSRTEVGSFDKGGYYTQEDYIDIINYASKYHITVIPEIDIPGHTNAALSSYASLNCNGETAAPYIGTKVGFSSLCVRDESIYEFVDDVIREISELTSGPYIHIGGDEPKATPKKDYTNFIGKVQSIVQKYKKVMIGWDDILDAKLHPSTSVQIWQPNVNQEKIVDSQSNSFIVSCANKLYLDMKYDNSTRLGLDWAGYISVETAYDWDIESLFNQQFLELDSIIGIEAPLWTETISDQDDIDFMVFPRLLGVAEIAWSGKQSWETYKIRLGKQKLRLEAHGINYYKSPEVPWTVGLVLDQSPFIFKSK